MKLWLTLFSIVCFAGFDVSAQVITVEVKLDQQQFLPGETLPITVRVFNNSGQSLHLGADANWLTFSIQANNSSAVVRQSDPPVIGAFDLNSSEVVTKRLDIAPYYSLKRAGNYRITATVHISQWNTEVTSRPQEFDIIDGAEIWSRDFGMPSSETNRPPDVRKYILEEANYLRRQLRLYVLVSNQSRNTIYKVAAIGPMVSFSQPDAQLDPASNLHVLYQSGAQNFIYSVVDPDGNITSQEAYDLLDTRPRMSVNAAGDIIVIGGVRRVKAGEFPDIKTPDEVVPPAPAPSNAPPVPAKKLKTPRGSRN